MLRARSVSPVLATFVVATTVLAQEIAPGVDLLPGRFVPGTQPDGNTVVIHAPAGLIVVDTGRHTDHTQAILGLAARAGAPIAAIVNTHWHLDHIGGNPRVRRAYPDVQVWASGALAEARTGFLAGYRTQLVDAIAATKDAATRAGYEAEVKVIDAGEELAPNETVTASGPRPIAGRTLRLGLEGPAVTKGDLWVLDPATGVLAAGDLVTLPVPLLDTACARGWQTALAHLAQLELTVLVPGHGPPMTRAQLENYRTGFDHLLACTASPQSEQVCIEGWLRDLGPLIPEGDRGFARTLLQYYVPATLRAGPERTARLCGEPASTPPPAP
jgi:glyoxylase-like metal-dependent hydrolase (beta-lactamase superfamily II)